MALGSVVPIEQGRICDVLERRLMSVQRILRPDLRVNLPLLSHFLWVERYTHLCWSFVCLWRVRILGYPRLVACWILLSLGM